MSHPNRPSNSARSVQAPQPKAVAIDLDDSTQATWWATYFGVSRAELLVAILRVGRDADAVRMALGKPANGPPSAAR